MILVITDTVVNKVIEETHTFNLSGKKYFYTDYLDEYGKYTKWGFADEHGNPIVLNLGDDDASKALLMAFQNAADQRMERPVRHVGLPDINNYTDHNTEETHDDDTRERDNTITY